MVESNASHGWSTRLARALRQPPPRLQVGFLGTAAIGAVLLVANGVSPFLPASVDDDRQTGLIPDPSAGNGVAPDPGFVWVTASAYGGRFLGQETACGEVLEPNSRIVAHRDLACGTPLEVRVEDDSVTAKVGDRGPFVDGRELDLAPGVWRELGFDSIADFGVRGVQVQLMDG